MATGGHPPRGKMVDGRHGGKDNGDGRAGGENKDNQHSYSNPLGPRSNLPIKRYLTGKQRFVFRFAFGGKICGRPEVAQWFLSLADLTREGPSFPR